jgi:hypothetical protein
VPLQRVQGSICGGSGSAERMRIVPRPRQVGHCEGMGLLGCIDADRAACSRAGRVVNFRQCHGRPRAMWFCVRLPWKTGSEWVHEIKHDGYRLMARRDPIGIRLADAERPRLVTTLCADR